MHRHQTHHRVQVFLSSIAQPYKLRRPYFQYCHIAATLSDMSTTFEETLKQAVAPGPQRLLAGAALAAAGSRNEGTATPFSSISSLQALFIVCMLRQMQCPRQSSFLLSVR